MEPFFFATENTKTNRGAVWTHCRKQPAQDRCRKEELTTMLGWQLPIGTILGELDFPAPQGTEKSIHGQNRTLKDVSILSESKNNWMVLWGSSYPHLTAERRAPFVLGSELAQGAHFTCSETCC